MEETIWWLEESSEILAKGLLMGFLPGMSTFMSTFTSLFLSLFMSMTTADRHLAGMSRVEAAAGWKRPAWSWSVPGLNKTL